MQCFAEKRKETIRSPRQVTDAGRVIRFPVGALSKVLQRRLAAFFATALKRFAENLIFTNDLARDVHRKLKTTEQRKDSAFPAPPPQFQNRSWSFSVSMAIRQRKFHGRPEAVTTSSAGPYRALPPGSAGAAEAGPQAG